MTTLIDKDARSAYAKARCVMIDGYFHAAAGLLSTAALLETDTREKDSAYGPPMPEAAKVCLDTSARLRWDEDSPELASLFTDKALEWAFGPHVASPEGEQLAHARLTAAGVR